MSTFTVEGNAAGAFASKLEDQQAKKAAAIEAEKERIAAEARRKTEFTAIDAVAASSASQFTQKVTGLTTIETYRQARDEVASKEAATKIKAGLIAAAAAAGAPAKGTTAGAVDLKRKKPVLSFAGDEDDEEEEEASGPVRGPVSKKQKIEDPAAADASSSSSSSASSGTLPSAAAAAPAKLGKDPTAETDFLPDAEREKTMAALQERLKREFLEQQEKEKKEIIEVTYSWWDGTGHRRTLKIQKGRTIGQFLEAVRQALSAEFPTLNKISSSGLIFVKEDFILPHSITFYELISHKVRGKSGPLFDFSARDDVRLVNDARVEKEDAHPGKVLERSFYERSKHSFPYSRYEVWTWTKAQEMASASYTTHGGEVNSKK